MIIQTIGLDPSGAIRTDEAPNLSRLDPSGADQTDAEHPTRNRKSVPHVLRAGVSHVLAGFGPNAVG
jgi:hypothetical protein